MDNPLKESYRIGKILKRLTGIKFLKSKQTSEISLNGKTKADSYIRKKAKGTSRQQSSSSSTETHSSHVDKYLHYQKELEAVNLMGSERKPKPPGRIPKLPTGRKEMMVREKD
jgi:hypothetical protein